MKPLNQAQLNNAKVSDPILSAGKEHGELVTDPRKLQNLCWIQHPVITRHINQLISGDPEMDWLSWFKSNYTREPYSYGLSLGCGTGYVEREAIQKGICLEFEGIDITPESIAKAEQAAKENQLADKLHYSVQDINTIRLPIEKYNLVLISHALHHVKNLEHVLREIRAAIKPGGFLYFSEYIGPSQFQFTEDQLRLMNDWLAELPEKYRKDLRNTELNKLKDPVQRPTREFMNQADPSEAIRSDEIMRLLEFEFEIMERRDYGGTILQFLLADIAGNFNMDIEEDRQYLEKLCNREQELIDSGELDSDFTIIVARPKYFFERLSYKLSSMFFPSKVKANVRY